MDWDTSDPHNLEKVKRLVSRGIAARQIASTARDFGVSRRPFRVSMEQTAAGAEAILAAGDAKPSRVTREAIEWAAARRHCICLAREIAPSDSTTVPLE
jgi:hypothetical protein